jgi:TRAP-type C4-dicarboxylate transport system substrate-binding protein
MRRIVYALVACAIAAAVATEAGAQRLLRVNESLGPGSVEDVALQEFKRLVEANAAAGLQIRIFHNDALGNPQTSLENLTTGTLDLYSGAMEYYQPIAPVEIGLMSVPYVLRDHAHMRRYLTSAAFAPARDRLLARGIRFISTEFNADRGPYRVFVSTRAVTQLSDLQGLRIRMFPNEIAVRAWRHLGTVPTILPHTETYLALRQGVVQGAPYPIAAVRPTRFAEVAPFLFRTDEFPQTWPITISERVWAQLSAVQRDALVAAANTAGKLYASETLRRVDGDIEAMRRENNLSVAQVDLGAFRRHMQTFHQDLIREGAIPQALYDAVAKLADAP